jgi:type III secretory pathway component EscV
MTKMGGLKKGIKQGESTRRLDESISSSDFETSRKKPLRLARHVRAIGEQVFYVLIGVTLLFCAVRFALQTWFPGKVHQLLAPIMGKNSTIIEQTLTGASTPATDSDEETEESQTQKEEKNKKEETSAKKTQTKLVKQSKKAQTPKRSTRSKRRGRHRAHRHSQQRTHQT